VAGEPLSVGRSKRVKKSRLTRLVLRAEPTIMSERVSRSLSLPALPPLLVCSRLRVWAASWAAV
jgi:hypothetical protein